MHSHQVNPCQLRIQSAHSLPRVFIQTVCKQRPYILQANHLRPRDEADADLVTPMTSAFGQSACDMPNNSVRS